MHPIKCEYPELTILSILQKVTYVTKTRKASGFHIYWLSRKQNPSIPSHKYKVKSGSEFEIKTDKQMCTLPHSTHREDFGFRYYAIGRTDKLLLHEELYVILCKLLESCLLIRDEEQEQNSEGRNRRREESNNGNIKFHSLSPEAILISVDYLSPYAIRNYRNSLALVFGGTAFHFRIAEQSAAKILEGTCERAGDEEKNNRLQTLHSTYKKGR